VSHAVSDSACCPGDKELLALAEEGEGIHILPPRAAWELLFPR